MIKLDHRLNASEIQNQKYPKQTIFPYVKN